MWSRCFTVISNITQHINLRACNQKMSNLDFSQRLFILHYNDKAFWIGKSECCLKFWDDKFKWFGPRFILLPIICLFISHGAIWEDVIKALLAQFSNKFCYCLYYFAILKHNDKSLHLLLLKIFTWPSNQHRTLSKILESSLGGFSINLHGSVG